MSNISHIPKELSYIYADELYDEVKRLERQLAEAREFEKRIKHHCQAYENTGNAWFNMNRIYKEVEQLKEQDQ